MLAEEMYTITLRIFTMIHMVTCTVSVLKLKKHASAHTSSTHTIYRVIKHIGLCHHSHKKSNDIAKASNNSHKSSDF